MHKHELFMRRCLDLARLGMGTVSPNPMVGALLVHRGQVIAENYHQRYGQGHAEALVIREITERYGDQAAGIFEDSTLYVTLEPCSHHGKTPPCANLILRHRIPRVVVAMVDPSDKVNGKGISLLREAGVEVTVGVLEAEARWLNRRFITQVRQHRPYIILNWAQTADGYMAPVRQEQRWITGPESKQLVHRWRSEEDAVLVGSGTALADDPRLDVREWQGRNPRRVLIDRQLKVPQTAALYNDAAETIVFNEHKMDWEQNIRYISLENFGLYTPQQIAYQLYLLDIQSLIVEGGILTLQSFIEAGLWDEARILQAQVRWEEGRKAPLLEGRLLHTVQSGRDTMFHYVRQQTDFGTLFA